MPADPQRRRVPRAARLHGKFHADLARVPRRGRLDQLGPREEIKSMRWFDDLAIMVTFRRVDPLYAIDLSDTAEPTLLGKLKIPIEQRVPPAMLGPRTS